MNPNSSGLWKSISVFAGLIVLLAVSLVWAFSFRRSQVPVTFETSPRMVASGSDPSITVRDTGDIYMLKAEKGNLWFERSMDGGDTFGHPVRANDAEGEVMPHAEAQPRLYLRGGKPYALWQARRGGDSDAMKLRFARSTDYGESFTKAIDVDPSSTASQSFFNMNVSPKGTIYVVWLDGREKGGAKGGAAVYLARSTDNGASFEKSVRVALSSCPCCRPSIAFSDDNTVHVGFRELFDGDVRDMAVATSTDGGKSWGNPVRVAVDNWQINGCPHSGPSLAVLGKRLYVSWFTVHEKEQQSYIFLAHSDDKGGSFSDRQSLSDGTVDANHPFLLPVQASNKLLAVFQARDPQSNSGWGKIHAYLREVSPEGSISPLMAIGNLGASASNPTMAYEAPGHLFLAWTESGDAGSSVVFARGRLATNSGMGGIHAD